MKEECVCPVGTSFKVKNLFFNVPARRNFLKKDSTEFRHIQEEFERIALAHPDIRFIFTHNGKELLQLQPGVLKKRIANVLGENQLDRLIPVEESTDIVKIKGFVLKPEYSRKTRGDQFFFVNNRFFKSSYFHHAVQRAFENLIPAKNHPGYFLFFEVDPSKIDVNVHPTKTEIKFEDERSIYAILTTAVKLSLGKYNIAPSLDFDVDTTFDIPLSDPNREVKVPKINVDENYNPFHVSKTKLKPSSFTGAKQDNFSSAINKQGFDKEHSNSVDWEEFYSIEDLSDSEQLQLIKEEEREEGTNQFIIKGNLLFLPSRSGLMVIHYKRAIEQIVYEELQQRFIHQPIHSQSVLFPFEKELTNKELECWRENEKLLNQLGFKGEIKDHQLILSAIPSVLGSENVLDCIDDIISTLFHKDIDKGDIAHYLILSIAKSASKEEISLKDKEAVEGLVNRLFQCQEHNHTSSGLKIIETIHLDEIYKNFKN